MAYNPSTNIVVSGKTFMDVPAVQFKTPNGATVNFAHVGGQIRFSPTLEEQTEDVANYQDVIINPITSTLLNQLDSDFVAENIKKDVDLFGLVGTSEGEKAGIVTGYIIPAEDITGDIEITHNLGEIPKLAVVYRELSADGFGNETITSGEVAFSMAINNEEKGCGYYFDSSSYSSSINLAVGMFSYPIDFSFPEQGYAMHLNGSCIHSCTETTAKLYPIINNSKKFVAGHKYRWILMTEAAFNGL